VGVNESVKMKVPSLSFIRDLKRIKPTPPILSESAAAEFGPSLLKRTDSVSGERLRVAGSKNEVFGLGDMLPPPFHRFASVVGQSLRAAGAIEVLAPVVKDLWGVTACAEFNGGFGVAADEGFSECGAVDLEELLDDGLLQDFAVEAKPALLGPLELVRALGGRFRLARWCVVAGL